MKSSEFWEKLRYDRNVKQKRENESRDNRAVRQGKNHSERRGATIEAECTLVHLPAPLFLTRLDLFGTFLYAPSFQILQRYLANGAVFPLLLFLLYWQVFVR
jgi:hypothetical protein